MYVLLPGPGSDFGLGIGSDLVWGFLFIMKIED